MEFTYTKPITEEVPKEIRLEVYKRAKYLIENWEECILGLSKPELCLLLPCILYNCSNYLEKGTCDTYWKFDNTIIGFTEFTEESIQDICESVDKNKKRLELINKWIKQLNK